MLNNNISVVVPYHKNSYGLVYTLTMLQNQTVKPSKIIIIDTSNDKSGLSISKMFAYNDITIVVVCMKVNIYKAWNEGISLSGQDNVLIINDDITMPINFIEILKYSLSQKNSLCFVPKTSSREHHANFITTVYANKAEGQISFSDTDWMPGFCFLLTRECIEKVGVFNTEKYEIWFGDDDYQDRMKLYGKQNSKTAITLINGIFVYHFMGRSYRYQSKEILKIIAKDRKNYLKL